MVRKMGRFAALVVGLTLPLGACDGGFFGADEGRISVMLTDAPGDFEQATVTISEIYLQGEAEGGEKVVLRDEPVTTDLLTLANDVESLVEDATVPAGTYAQLRFVVPEACIVVEGESGSEVYSTSSEFTECGAADGELQTPSYDETGIKVNLPGGAVEVTGEQTVLVVDFNVEESFGQQAGAAGMWVMTPVLRATDFDLTASVSLSVQAADTVSFPTVNGSAVTLADFEATLDDAEGNEQATVSLTESSETGAFTATFQYLNPDVGPFSVELDAPSGVSVTTDPSLPVEVDASSGAEADVSVTVTSATS